MTQPVGPMGRRSFLKGAAAATAGAALAGVSAPFNIRTAAAAGPDDPIIVIVVDDLMDYAAMDRYFQRPRTSNFNPWMSHFAKTNTQFINAHCASPACGSARPAMWWGRPPHETGILTHRDKDKAHLVLGGQPSVISELRNAGWNTHGFGKIFHTFTDPGCWVTNVGHQQPTVAVGATGFSTYSSNTMSPFGPTYGVGPRSVSDHDMVTAAVNKVKTMGQLDAVFVGIVKPHVPLQVPNRYFDVIDPSEIILPDHPIPPLTGDALKFQQSAYASDMVGVISAGEWRLLIHSYLAAVKFADFQFKRIFQAAPDNARILLTSDHGFALGERGAFSKQTLWDQSTAIPIVIGSKGGVGHKKVRTAVSALDIPATLRDFAGISGGGDSLLAIADAPQDNSRAVVTSYETRPQFGRRRASAVRTWHHQLIVYEDGSDEMYWVPGDPFTLTDIGQRSWEQDNKAALMAHVPTSYATL